MLNRNSKIVNDAYLIYIRQRPCVGCGKTPVDAAHVKARGFGEGKRNDYCAIPLCRKCHRWQHDHGVAEFEKRYHVNLWEEAFWAFLEYCLQKGEYL